MSPADDFDPCARCGAWRSAHKAGLQDPTTAHDFVAITKVIGRCPRDGREWECQCARCGSSMYFVDCDNCGGEGWIEDDDWQADEGDGYDCDWCRGAGGYWACCSSAGWCETNPRDGRADVERGAVEWFTFDPPKGSKP